MLQSFLPNKHVWLKIFSDLNNHGIENSPRGLKTKNLYNYEILFHPLSNRFCSFKERKLSLSYNLAEWAWYLSADRNDTRMESYAPFWLTVKNEKEPYYNSNYGYYFFGEKQFDYVFDSLKKDKNSRQACIIINRPEVMMSDSKDKLCTYSINFYIDNNENLNMIVHMRSNCVITGLGIDGNMFSFLYEMLFIKLLEIYPYLKVGSYIHQADNFHIYENHWPIMKGIIENNGENYYEINCPYLNNVEEVDFVLKHFSKMETSIREKGNWDYQLTGYKFFDFAIDKITKRWIKK